MPVWTVGAGIEGVLVNNWTWKLPEYLYVDLGSIATSSPGPFTGATTARAQFTDNIIRGGLNFADFSLVLHS